MVIRSQSKLIMLPLEVSKILKSKQTQKKMFQILIWMLSQTPTCQQKSKFPKSLMKVYWERENSLKVTPIRKFAMLLRDSLLHLRKERQTILPSMPKELRVFWVLLHLLQRGKKLRRQRVPASAKRFMIAALPRVIIRHQLIMGLYIIVLCALLLSMVFAFLVLCALLSSVLSAAALLLLWRGKREMRQLKKC